MDYSYNYGHLRQFMEAHKLTKKDILEALGCSDYVSLNKWLDGKVPMHVTAMLRFCNYYNEPMDGFFCDADGMPVTITPTLPKDDDQLTPTDGHGIKEGPGRGIVETKIDRRVITSQKQAAVVADGLARQTQQRNRRDQALRQQRQQRIADTTAELSQMQSEEALSAPAVAQPNVTETVLRLQLEHQQELRRTETEAREREDRVRRDCQASFDAERNRLMDIIERQNNELSKFYARSGTSPHYMVAEEDSAMRMAKEQDAED